MNTETLISISEHSALNISDILDNFQDVKAEVEAACSDKEAITSLVGSLIAELNKREVAEIAEQQQNNIKSFIEVFAQLLPRETATELWVQMLANARTKGIVIRLANDENFKKCVRNMYYGNS